MLKTVDIQLRDFTRRLSDGSIRGRFLNGVIWSFIGAVFSRGLMLISTVLAGRILGPQGFGQLSVVQNTVGIFGVLAGAGLGVTAIKYVSQFRNSDSKRCGQYIRISHLVAVITGVVATIGLLVSAGWIAKEVLLSASLSVSLRWAATLVLFSAITGVQVGALAGLEDFRGVAVLTIVRGGSLLVLMTAGSWLGGVTGALIGMVVTEFVTSLIGYAAVIRASRKAGIPLPSSTDWHELRAIWRFALPALLSSVVVLPAIWASNIILVNQPAGYAAVGIFSAADTGRQLILFLPTTISALILSMLSNLHGSDNHVAYRKVFRANLAVSLISVILPVVAMILFAKQAISAFGLEYSSGAPTLIILSLSVVFVILNNVLGQVLVSIGLIWKRFALDLLLAVLLLLASLWLIPTYMQNGLAAANLCAYALTVGVLYAIVRIELVHRNLI